MIRLSTAGVKGSPVISAECRVWISALSRPSLIQSVSPIGKPLSKTDWAAPEDAARTTGSHSSPAAYGSLHSRTGTSVSVSPTRVPPPGRLNTVRPSSASRATAVQ